MKKIKAHRTTTSTSRHEAAHAVIAEKLGCRVRSLTLHAQNGQILGGTELDGRSLKQVGPFAMGLMLMAGSVADNYWGTARVGIVSGDDADALKHMGANAMCFRGLYYAVRPMVVKHRAAIERVAKRLAKAGKLSGREVREL